MKKALLTLLLGMSLTTQVVAQNLEVLETYDPNSQYDLHDVYPEFDLAISAAGDIIGLYGLTSYGMASYIAKQYPQGEPAQDYYIGGHSGNGGWFNPTLCGLEDENLLIQITYFGDMDEPYVTHKLITLDLTGNHNRIDQYFFSEQSQVLGIWKSDSTHGCSFFKKWVSGGEDIMYFIKEIDLFTEYQYPFDSSFVVNGDTLLAIPSVSSYSQEKLRSSDVYLAIYDLSSSDDWSGVCVTLDSVVTQIDSIFPKSTTMPQLSSTEEAFMALYKSFDGGEIFLWTYNPLSGAISNELVYTSPTGSHEYLGGYQATILPDELVLQIPVLKDESSSAVSNWQALINKRVSRGDYSILAADTIFIFEAQTEIIRHQIKNDGVNVHALIATRTPAYSTIYYYGINDLVKIQPEEEELRTLPANLAIRNAYPNPFNNELRIELSNSDQFGEASLQIFDLKGRLVWTKKDIQGTAFIWNGQDLSGQDVNSGVYLLNLSNGSNHDSQKILLIK